MRKTLLTAAVACVMAVGGNGWANDPQKHGDKSAMNLKQVERDDVPEATLTAVTKKHPDAKVKSFSQSTRPGETLSYVVALEEEDASGKTKQYEMTVGNNGQVISEREVLAMNEIPDKVKQGFDKSRYGSWEVTQIEKAIKGERVENPQYQITVSQEKTGQLTRTIFDKDGKLVTTERVASASDSRNDVMKPRSTNPNDNRPIDPGINSPMNQDTNTPVAPDQTNRP